MENSITQNKFLKYYNYTNQTMNIPKRFGTLELNDLSIIFSWTNIITLKIESTVNIGYSNIDLFYELIKNTEIKNITINLIHVKLLEDFSTKLLPEIIMNILIAGKNKNSLIFDIIHNNYVRSTYYYDQSIYFIYQDSTLINNIKNFMLNDDTNLEIFKISNLSSPYFTKIFIHWNPLSMFYSTVYDENDDENDDEHDEFNNVVNEYDEDNKFEYTDGENVSENYFTEQPLFVDEYRYNANMFNSELTHFDHNQYNHWYNQMNNIETVVFTKEDSIQMMLKHKIHEYPNVEFNKGRNGIKSLMNGFMWGGQKSLFYIRHVGIDTLQRILHYLRK